MEKVASKIRLAKCFFTGEYCLKTNKGKRLTRWFKTYDEDDTGDFVLLETNIGTFLYHKNKPEVLYENYRDGEGVYFYKLTEELYCLETTASDHAPFIWLYHSNGDKIDMPVLEDIGPLAGDLIYAREYGGKYGMLNEQLNWKVQPCYEEIYDHIKGIFAGLRSETHTTDLIRIDKNGKVHIVNIDGYIGEEFTQGLVATKKNRKWGVYNTRGEKILDIAYDNIWFRGTYFSLQNAGLYGIADITGKILCDCKYYRIKKTETGFELVTRQVIDITEHITV